MLNCRFDSYRGHMKKDRKPNIETLKAQLKEMQRLLDKAIRDEKIIATFYYEGKVNKIIRQIKRHKNG